MTKLTGFLNWIGKVQTSKNAKGVVIKRRSIGLAVQGEEKLQFVTLFDKHVTGIESVAKRSRVELDNVLEKPYTNKDGEETTSRSLGKFGTIKILSPPKEKTAE